MVKRDLGDGVFVTSPPYTPVELERLERDWFGRANFHETPAGDVVEAVLFETAEKTEAGASDLLRRSMLHLIVMGGPG